MKNGAKLILSLMLFSGIIKPISHNTFLVCDIENIEECEDASRILY